MKKHVMIDIETLSLDRDAVVFSIGATVIGNQTESLYLELDITEQIKLGRKVDGDTLKWWSKQPIPMPINGEAPIAFALGQLFGFLTRNTVKEDVFVWANSPSFDLAILESLGKGYQFGKLWKYSNERDFRTIRAFHPVDMSDYQSVAHNALDDAKWQATYLERTGVLTLPKFHIGETVRMSSSYSGVIDNITEQYLVALANEGAK